VSSTNNTGFHYVIKILLKVTLNTIKQTNIYFSIHLAFHVFLTSKNKTNQQGEWCKETSQENSTEHKTDKTLIPQISKLLSDKTVASFGDGPGFI